MNKPIISAICAIIALSSGTALAAEQTIKLSVPDMRCASCPYMVKKAISSLDGIKQVEATMEDRSATVVYEDTLTNLEAIQQATAKIGYPSSLFEKKSGS